MPFVEASDGAKIFWQAQGSGPPLLLSNASFSTHLHWAGQVDALARFARVVTWDYRGHGLSDAPEQAERSGGRAGVPADACYHLACDGRTNVDQARLLVLARALVRVAAALAGGDR